MENSKPSSINPNPESTKPNDHNQQNQMNQTLYFNKQIFIKKTKGSVTDTYTKIKDLGQGGYSCVYSIQNKKTKEIFACKEISKTRLKDKEKIKTEIEILMKTDHKNIVRLYEIYEDKIYVYLVMELCKGGELFERINKKKGFTEKEACYVFKQLITALNYCHSVLKICHRDLKPENILLVSEDINNLNVKIGDFGLGAIYNKKDNNFTQTVGSSYYIAPEVINGSYNYKCDLWSAGVILYILLCGVLPFNSTPSRDLYKHIIEIDYNFDLPQWKNVSDEAKDLLRCLLCEENKRITAQEVLHTQWIKKFEVENLISYNLINNYTYCSMSSKEPQNFNRLKNYVSLNKLKKIILTVIASKLSDDEINSLKQQFINYDLNMDGTITLKEFITFLSKYEKIDNKLNDVIVKLFQSVDTDSSGRIDFTEFLAWTIEKKMYLDERKLYQSFAQFDINGSGKISKAEFKKVLKIKGSFYDKKINEIYEKYDLNKDGLIDYEEFLYMMNRDD